MSKSTDMVRTSTHHDRKINAASEIRITDKVGVNFELARHRRSLELQLVGLCFRLDGCLVFARGHLGRRVYGDVGDPLRRDYDTVRIRVGDHYPPMGFSVLWNRSQSGY
jgi:hypothetical protein